LMTIRERVRIMLDDQDDGALDTSVAHRGSADKQTGRPERAERVPRPDLPARPP
jgi:hypothetical protein